MDEDLSPYLSSTSLIGIWLMTIAPESTLRRVIETVSLGESSVQREFSLELALTTSEPLLIPILKPRRGVLVDNLRLQGDGTTRTFTLNREETITVTIHVIRRIVESTLNRMKLDPESPPGNRATNRFCLFPSQPPKAGLRILHVMSVLQRLDDVQVAEIGGSNTEYLRYLKALGSDSEFIDLMAFFRTNRLILVPFSANFGNRIQFSYEAGLREVVQPGVYRGARAALGHAPYDLRFEIPFAIRTQSYHFRFRAPPGQYIYCQEVLVPRFSVPTRLNPQDWELMHLPHNRARGFVEGDHATSSNYSHLYVGNIHLGSPVPRRMFAHVRFCERPVGEMGKTLFLVSVCFGVLLAIAFYGAALIQKRSDSGDVIAILAILPGLVAYVSSARGKADSPVISPLVARAGPVIASYCSLAGAILILAWSTTSNSSSLIWSMPPGVFVAYLLILAVLTMVIIWSAFRTLVGIYRFGRTKDAEVTATLRPHGDH